MALPAPNPEPKPVVFFEDEQQVVIDRDRITHGESTDMSFAGARIEKMNRDLAAGKDVDFDELRRLVESVDELVARTVVSLPSSWLSAEDFAQPGWIKKLPQSKYERLMQLSRPPQGNDPKA